MPAAAAVGLAGGAANDGKPRENAVAAVGTMASWCCGWRSAGSGGGADEASGGAAVAVGEHTPLKPQVPRTAAEQERYDQQQR